MGTVEDNRERMLSEGTHPAQIPEGMAPLGGASAKHRSPVHSTAAEGAVTRTNKSGYSMPILTLHPNGGYHVEHEGHRVGQIWQTDEGWFAGKHSGMPGKASGPHLHRGQAVANLFDMDQRMQMFPESWHFNK